MIFGHLWVLDGRVQRRSKYQRFPEYPYKQYTTIFAHESNIFEMLKLHHKIYSRVEFRGFIFFRQRSEFRLNGLLNIRVWKITLKICANFAFKSSQIKRISQTFVHIELDAETFIQSSHYLLQQVHSQIAW